LENRASHELRELQYVRARKKVWGLVIS
jgi:hypothetical protein